MASIAPSTLTACHCVLLRCGIGKAIGDFISGVAGFLLLMSTLALSFSCWLVATAVSWLFFRPVAAYVMLAVALGSAVVFVWLKRKGQNAAPVAPTEMN